jgi:raffinose/stachyose/melibiose transport system substrate-binding protein
MKTTRWSAGLLAVGMVAGLAACSSGGGESDDGRTELLVWDAGLLTRVSEDGKVDGDASFLHQAADRFEEENPDVSVKIVTSTGDISQNSAQFQAASIAGDGPDVRTGYTGGNTLSFEDFLLDLDGVFDEETMADLSGWNTVRAGYREDGPLLALPYGGGSYFYVFYNKDMAEAAGVDLSTPPETWEDFLDVVEEVKAAGQPPVWLGNQEGYVGAWVISALVGGELGGTVFTDMFNGEVPIDDDAMKRAYEAYAELFSRGLTNPDAGSVSNGEHAAGFAQEKGTFLISGGWDNATLIDTLGADKVGVFPIPMLEGAQFPNTVAGGPNVAVSITNYTEKQEIAEDFVRFLAQPDTIDLYVELFQTEASNSASADPSVITNPLLQTEAEDLKTTENITFPFDNVMPQAVIDSFYKANATTFLGTTTADDALAQLKQTFETETANR